MFKSDPGFFLWLKYKPHLTETASLKRSPFCWWWRPIIFLHRLHSDVPFSPAEWCIGPARTRRRLIKKKVALGLRVRPRNTIGVIRTKETTAAVTIMINSLGPLARDYRVSRAANPSWRCRKLRRKLCHRIASFQAAAEWKHESCHCRRTTCGNNGDSRWEEGVGGCMQIANAA